jgi:hypothetical protein
MKNSFKLFLGLMLIAGTCRAAQVCKSSDFWCYEAGPSQNLSTPARLDSSGTAWFNNMSLAVLGTADSSLGSGATNDVSIQVFLSTTSASAAVIGDVIVATFTVNGQVTGVVGQATSGLTNVIGIADAAGATGTVIPVGIYGLDLALTTGTITVGDLLVTTTAAAGYLTTNNSAAAGAIVGVAVNNGAIATPGLMRVLLKH